MTPSPTKPELVVGVGASAGGLRALEGFFQAMPCDSGCAFVVVQHLSPDFKSLMTDLLARHTRMRIHRVEEGMVLERDCVYLIPPRKLMTVKGGKLALTEREAARQLEFPINVFLDSLAADYGPQAVAIILSGTGTDGTQGVRSVHEAGGLVVVQSLESADFNGMPRSALNTELADYVLPPERMPEAVITYARYPQLRMSQNNRPMTPSEAATSLGPILERLRHAYGLDFGEYKLPTVQRRIHRRMSFLQMLDAVSYAHLLGENGAELDELYKDLLIGVTEFFRDPEAFECIGRDVLPALINEPGREELRLWVAGCATGEEAYSLAILADEQARHLGYHGRISIFATDMHRESLARASAGVFERGRVENLGPERIARYFKDESNGQLRIVPEIRQRIIFSSHNVINDPPFTKIDLLTCRNMLIYFQPATQERVISLFHYALKRGGCLFLGSSEGLGGLDGGFSAVSARHKIYRKTSESLVTPPEIRSIPTARNRRIGTLPPLGTPATTITVSRALLRAYDHLLKAALPPSMIVAENGEIIQFFGNSSQYLLHPEGRSHENLFNRTDGDLRLALSTLLPKAFKSGETCRARGIHHSVFDQRFVLDIEVNPIPDERTGIVLVQVVLRDVKETRPLLPPDTPAVATADFLPNHALTDRVSDLELELHTTKENLQATVEELQTSNEELQATNEELLAANEELQSTNEELHSVNEELYTVNAEFERKNHELKTIGEDLHNLLASTDVGTLFLDRNLRIRRFTPAIARIFHLLPQDISRPIQHIAYQIENEQDLLPMLETVLASGTPIEREVHTRDGAWLFQRVLPFRTAEDKIDGVVLTFTDISGVKSIQDKLNLAMEFSRMVWWEWDLSNQVLSTHTGGQSIFGYAGATVTTTSEEWMKLVHEDDRARVRTGLESCQTGEVSRWECQHRFLTRDGLWRWVVNKGKVAARDSTGRPIRMLGTTQDIHERFLAEQEIKKLNRALERGPIMVMITDLEGKIEYVNESFTETTGYTTADLLGKNPRVIKADEQPASVFHELWETLRRGHTWQGELLNRRKDGRLLRERATIGPLRDADGTTTHYVALKEEIVTAKAADDDQRRMEEQLSQVQKMETLGALAGGIAHDFNNILTAIIGHTELAAELAQPPHPAAECLQQVRQASLRASELVQRILSFSRRGPSHHERVDIGALVAEVIPLLRSSTPASVQVDFSLCRDRLQVLANPTDMQQVVLNLGGNAAHAMRDGGGVLRIRVEPLPLPQPHKATTGTLPAGDYIRLSVSDTGTGITPEVMARMFEPFFTTKPQGEGTGLGLSIILGIVLSHSGAIDVQTSVGHGTTFDVLLPALAANFEPTKEKRTTRTKGHGQRIAFVDDESAITMMAQRGLSLHGYSPTTFCEAQGLLTHLASGNPGFDLIITDQSMPGLTGLEMVKALRQSGHETPVIILSGNARYVSAEELADLGKIQFMPKPFDLASLLERVGSVLTPTGT
ncbi:MAG: PAS domain S-box protein [Opitutaceae bacterium]|jgi:two-component system CheB/CheR fusion protein|nr:PAS domain S-box protein [Opitutaceae bacterium]